MARAIKFDHAGKVFGNLTAIAHEGRGRWLCQCSCGNHTRVDGHALAHGHTRSCVKCKSAPPRATLGKGVHVVSLTEVDVRVFPSALFPRRPASRAPLDTPRRVG